MLLRMELFPRLFFFTLTPSDHTDAFLLPWKGIMTGPIGMNHEARRSTVGPLTHDKRWEWPPYGEARRKLSQWALTDSPTDACSIFHCSFSASLSKASSREVWQLQSWPKGPASPLLASSTSASYLISDPGSFYIRSYFSMNKGKTWLIGSISVAGSIHSSFLWNSALYLLLLLQCFFRNSISEPVRDIWV